MCVLHGSEAVFAEDKAPRTSDHRPRRGSVADRLSMTIEASHLTSATHTSHVWISDRQCAIATDHASVRSAVFVIVTSAFFTFRLIGQIQVLDMDLAACEVRAGKRILKAARYLAPINAGFLLAGTWV